AFATDNHDTGNKHTLGIEGNNCRFRHRIGRVFRSTPCFSKKLFNHYKAFDRASFYLNYAFR
ncbi:MAG: IS1 family transposase, partial [Treponema sp.]|nr:IS1 family transposase [Treponema sp.]